ncbi:hypothetical protein GH733_007356 [Mirounga leonina]|nr:hypothetical protein GH733_007356 [Mirounga leonina]
MFPQEVKVKEDKKVKQEPRDGKALYSESDRSCKQSQPSIPASCSVPGTICKHLQQAHPDTALLRDPHLPACSWSDLTKRRLLTISDSLLAGSRLTQSSSIYCASALRQALCETHTSRSSQTKESRRREHRQLQSHVCAYKKDTRSQEDTQRTRGHVIHTPNSYLEQAAEQNDFLTQELADDCYSRAEVQVTPTKTEIIILAARTQNVLGEKDWCIWESTAVVQKRFGFPGGTVELHAEKEATREWGQSSEVMVSRKLQGQRATFMKFVDDLLIHSGDPVTYCVDSTVYRTGYAGHQVKIVLSRDPSAKTGPEKPRPDHMTIMDPEDEILPTTAILEQKGDRGSIHPDWEYGKNTGSGDQISKQLSARCLESISLEATIAEKHRAEVQQKLWWRCSTGSCLHLDVGEAKSKKAKTEP